MKKRNLLFVTVLLYALRCMAGIPQGYYQAADCKSALELKQALATIIANHKVLGYSSLWEYYPFTYYVPGNPGQVLDMYSDDVTYFTNTTGLNKEHTVPKSWWGGSTASGPGCDIFNVIPSEQKANSAKSNYPLGIVTGVPTFDNNVTKVGKSGVEGYSGNVFEPKDDYKGDFARIYFYVATCYPDLSWDNNNAAAMTNGSANTLQSWIIPMLLEWHVMDPVDQAEIQRNEDIYAQQNNRNPFIDYPALAEYVWGGKQSEEFVFSNHTPNEGETSDMPTLVPTFDIDFGTFDNPKKVLDGTEVKIKGGTSQSELYYRVNGGDWVNVSYTMGYNETSGTEYHIPATATVTINGNTVIDAYCTREGFKESDVVTAYYCGVDFDGDFLLYEAFDAVTAGNNTSTSGSSSAWSGNANFPIVEKTYAAGNALKIGSGSATGSITSKTLNTQGGKILVELDVKGWTTVEGKLKVILTGAEQQIVEYTSTLSDDFEHFILTFDDVEANPVLTIATTSKRAFIDNISVSEVQETYIPHLSGENRVVNVYNLNGQRVGESYRGLIIVGGRKYFRK